MTPARPREQLEAYAAAFKAFIGRIEQNSGQKLDVGKVGEQDYWSIGKDGLEVVMATTM